MDFAIQIKLTCLSYCLEQWSDTLLQYKSRVIKTWIIEKKVCVILQLKYKSIYQFIVIELMTFYYRTISLHNEITICIVF